jgi:hypothetical protein
VTAAAMLKQQQQHQQQHLLQKIAGSCFSVVQNQNLRQT